MELAAINSNVYLTVLPNGSVNGKLQLTLLFTLSLEGDAYASSAFTAWNSEMASYILQRGSDWFVILSNFSSGVARAAIKVRIADTGYDGGLDKDMWQAIFACVDEKSSTRLSRAKPSLAKARVVTHDGAYMRAAFDDHRLKQFKARFIRDYPKNKAVKPADQTPYIQSAAAWQAEVNQQARSVDVYLRPTYSDANAGGVNLTMTQLLAAIAKAKSVWSVAGLGLSQAQFDLVDAYKLDAQSYLEETERLREVGHVGLYKHCLNACRLGIDNLGANATTAALAAVDTMATTMAQPLDLAAVTQAMKIVDFMILTRPSMQQVDCPPRIKPNPAPDFHQALSLVNRYTAMLRPLGLAIDLECDVPADIAGFDTIEIRMPTVPPTPAPGHSSFNSVPMKTRFLFTGAAAQAGRAENFYAASHWETMDAKAQAAAADSELLTRQRLLWLGATSNDTTRLGDPLFVTVAQDVDGSLQKMYTSTSADARATEYTGQTVDSDSSPSQRSTGISILHRGRGDRLQAALAKPSPLPTVPLFAEDVTLGYRVDVRKGDLDSPKAGDWFPLCARKSVYSILGNATRQWKPRSDYEKAADEGFVTLGSITSSDAGGDTISFSQQIHSWNGWSSSVPAFFDPLTGDQPDRTVKDPSQRVLPIDAEYDLPAGRKLLPLRFDRTYSFRCRAVDLAGNSIACPPKKTEPNATLPDKTLVYSILSHQMVRQEPTRSPQILLDAPIDRKGKPGDHVDTLILRTTRDNLERVLVAPRETLRMAELQGNLTSRDLPPGAFPNVFLNDDATFPTVSDAYEQGWFDRDGDRLAVEEKDPIFHIGDTEPSDCRYFPDPLARYVCAQLTTALPADDVTKIPQYLSLYPKGEVWPHTVPARIRVQSGDAFAIRVIPMRLNSDGPGMGTVDGLEITLPKAYRATLEISSAWCTNCDTTDKAPLVGLYQLNNQSDGARRPLAIGVPPKAGTPVPATLVTSIYKGGYTASSFPSKPALDALKLLKPGDFLNGLVQAQTPAHVINLVHAVKQPLMAPGFPAGFDMQRTLGQPAATMPPDVPALWAADWKSTSKITCRAKWTDCVDDLHHPCPVSMPHHEVVFEVTDPAQCPESDPAKCAADQIKKHLFRDTRAHHVTYTLTATSAFRDYYPPALDASFEHPEHPDCKIHVASSVRPAPPDIAYIIPAFRWVESYDEVKIIDPVTQRQRIEKIYNRVRLTYLRVYHNRPFFGSGDKERLCAILKQKTSASTTVLNYVSRMGLDPIGIPTKTSGPIMPSAELTADMFETPEAPVACYLAELPIATSAVDVIPFRVEFAKERGLWFTDILLRPISHGTDGVLRLAHAPMVRLALGRYQPHALSDPKTGTDAHLSPIVFADFMQLASNRWCSVLRHGKAFTLTLSGAANERATTDPKPLPPPGAAVWRSTDLSLNSLLTVELQHRWHDVEEEMGWRPVDHGSYKVTFGAPVVHDTGVTKRGIAIDLPESSALFKYRVLLMEEELFTADSASAPVAATRLGYFDIIEL